MTDGTPIGEQAVQVAVADGVATVMLNRPHVLNALNHALRDGLIAAFETLGADAAVRVIVGEGAGRALSAGQDQKEAAMLDTEGAARRIAAYAALSRVIRALEKPLVAKMRGHAAGAGLQIALLSDLRIAGVSAKLGMTELKVGSVAMMGSALLRLLVGEAVMRRLILMADFIPADEARACNLVDEVVADDALDGRVAEIAARLKSYSPVAVRLTKRWWRTMADDVFERLAVESKASHAENHASGGLAAGAKVFLSTKRV